LHRRYGQALSLGIYRSGKGAAWATVYSPRVVLEFSTSNRAAHPDTFANMRLSATVRALFFLGRTGPSLRRVERKGGGEGEVCRRITSPPVSTPNDCCPRKRHVWGTRAKPLAAYRRRLCCLCRQRKLDLEAERARLVEKTPNVMLYLELPEGLQGSKISFKRFKANIL